MAKSKLTNYPTFSRIELSHILNVSTLTIANREKKRKVS
jgi:hypothetical protein